ncbi:hypothetical protein [Kitasatospora acidiphila]|nr:hypothetical protein [Kitasatospora acidiphila]
MLTHDAHDAHGGPTGHPDHQRTHRAVVLATGVTGQVSPNPDPEMHKGFI